MIFITPEETLKKSINIRKKYEDILNGDMSQKELFVIDSFEDAGKLLPYMNIYYIDGVILGSKNSLNLPFKINHIGSVKAYEKVPHHLIVNL